MEEDQLPKEEMMNVSSSLTRVAKGRNELQLNLSTYILVPDLQIGSSSASSGKENTFGAKGSFSRGWPPMSTSIRVKLSSSQSG